MEEEYADYKQEIHDIYLGKNCRLADPVYLPGAITFPQQVARMEMEVDEPKEVPLPIVRDSMYKWGYGRYTRHPPGGPGPTVEAYETNLQALAADVHETWTQIKYLVSQHEDTIQKWVIDAYKKSQSDELSSDSEGQEDDPNQDIQCILGGTFLGKELSQSWYRAACAFNSPNEEIKKFMYNNDISSDFRLDEATRLPERRSSDYINYNNHFTRANLCIIAKNGQRTYYQARNCFSFANFFDLRTEWPLTKDYVHPDVAADGRLYLRAARPLFLAPHLNLFDLMEPMNLLTMIHHRARLHPSVFVKTDHDMTYLGRTTKYLTGPIVANRMVTFCRDDEDANMDQTVGYPAQLWKGWGKDSREPTPARRRKYRNLYYHGQLLGTSEAWIMLQSQRATYLFLHEFIDNILRVTGMTRSEGPRTISKVTRTAQEEAKIGKEALKGIEQLKASATENWRDIMSLRQYLPPPIEILKDRYVLALDAKICRAEEHIQRLFNEPEYFFDAIMELKDHHWANVTMKVEKTSSEEHDRFSEYIEVYQEEVRRHWLYYDCTRRVVRRAIFEFYIWNAVRERLVNFDNDLRKEFPHYRKPFPSSGGLDVNGEPPQLVNLDDPHKESQLFSKYLDLATLIRYYAVFFVNEFRKKGIHAASETMRDLAFGVGRGNLEAQERAPGQGQHKCPIVKRHYGSPDLDLIAKYKLSGTTPAEDSTRSFLFDCMNTQIAKPLDCMNSGIQRVTEFLQLTLTCEDESFANLFTDLMADTIDRLDLLADLANHLESLWPAMDFIGGAATSDERRQYHFGRAGDGIAIDLMAFDEFPFEDVVPSKRLGRLFAFFDEMQGFKKQTISIGCAKGDLKRFGTSLLTKLIIPVNKTGNFHASEEALTRLESAIQVDRDQLEFKPSEKELNLDPNKPAVWPKKTYRGTAARLRDLAKKRTDRLNADIDEWAMSDIEREKKRKQQEKNRKKKERKKEKARQRAESAERKGVKPRSSPAKSSGSSSGLEPGDPRYDESLHASIKQVGLPQLPKLRDLPGPTPAPVFSAPVSVKAPDGEPKRMLKKRVWDTLDCIYGFKGIANASVSWLELCKAMSSMGYQWAGRGGSHADFEWTVECRWPRNALPKGHAIQLARNHEGQNSAAAKGKSRDWGIRLEQRGMTFDFVKRWYVKQKK